MAKASIACNPLGAEGLAEEAVALFFAALADCGLTEKAAAYTMALDPAQLSRVKHGQARLPFDAMWRLPNPFWLALRGRIDAAKQLTPAHAQEVRAQRIGELIKLLVEVA